MENVKDVTYSVKLTQEMVEKIKGLVESQGLSNKELISTLISDYELQQAKIKTPALSSDIEEIQIIFNKLNRIFANMGERYNTLSDNYKQELATKTSTNNELIQTLQQRIKMLETNTLVSEQQAKEALKDKEAAEARAKELQEKINDKSAIIEELNKHKQASEENKTLHVEIEKYRKLYETASSELKQKETKVESLQQENEGVITKHQQFIKTIEDKLNIEHEKKILELRGEQQRKLEEIQSNYALKLNTYELNTQNLLKQLESKSKETAEAIKEPKTTKPKPTKEQVE